MPVIVATQTLSTRILKYFLAKLKATIPSFEEDITMFSDMKAKGPEDVGYLTQDSEKLVFIFPQEK